MTEHTTPITNLDTFDADQAGNMEEIELQFGEC